MPNWSRTSQCGLKTTLHLACRRKKLSAMPFFRFGNPTVMQERVAAADALVLDSIRQDLQYGIYGLLKSPGFTITATLTLALGIGINSSLYSLASGILRQLPIHTPDRVGVIVATNTTFEEDRGPLSVPEFLFLRDQAQSFSEVAAGDSSTSLNLAGSGEPERLTAFQVSPNYFQLVGVAAELGRTLLPGEDRPEQRHVVILEVKACGSADSDLTLA